VRNASGASSAALLVPGRRCRPTLMMSSTTDGAAAKSVVGASTPGAARRYQARQVIDLPEVRPVVTEHRAHTLGCACGHETTAAFPDGVRSPVSYGPRVRATVAFLLARQHIPGRRVAETMAELFG
jgi:zinc-finger binding domain of transposase IS66